MTPSTMPASAASARSGDDEPERHRLEIRRMIGGARGRCGCGAAFRVRGNRGPARQAIRRAHRGHVDDVRDHDADLGVDCASCPAVAGAPCVGLGRHQVHGSRRIRRLLAGIPTASTARRGALAVASIPEAG